MPSVIKSQWLTGLASSRVKKATSSPSLFIPLFWSWVPQQHGIDLQNNTDAKRASIFVYKTAFKAFQLNTNPMSGGTASELRTESWKPSPKTGFQFSCPAAIADEISLQPVCGPRVTWSHQTLRGHIFKPAHKHFFFPITRTLSQNKRSLGEVKRGQGTLTGWPSSPAVR